MKKLLLITAITSLTLGTASSTLKFQTHFSKAKANNVGDDPAELRNYVTMHNYQFNDPKSTTPEYGVSFNFHISYADYNYFNLLLKAMNRHAEGLTSDSFYDYFIGKDSTGVPLSWEKLVYEYHKLVAEAELNIYHVEVHTLDNEVKNFLLGNSALFKQNFLGDQTTNTLDPKNYHDSKGLKAAFRQKGAIWQIALDNIGGTWKLDTYNTRIMVWNSNNDYLSFYYYNPEGSGALVYEPPTIYIKIPNWDPEKTYTVGEEFLNYIEPAIEKTFDFPSKYIHMYRIIQADFDKKIQLEGSKPACKVGLNFERFDQRVYPHKIKSIKILPIIVAQSKL